MRRVLIPCALVLVPATVGAQVPRMQARAGSLDAVEAGVARFAAAKRTGKAPRRLAARSRKPARARRARRDVVVVERPRQYVDEHVHVRRGDTLEQLLAMRGLGGESARPWLAAAADVYDLRQVRPRHGCTLRFDRASGELEAIRYEIDRDSMLVLERDGDEVEARIEALPYLREVRGIVGSIQNGLREDATAAGVPPSVAAALGDIFGWDLDVEHGLAPGDEFRVIYENLWEIGRAEPLTGTVIAAEISTRGRRHTALFFEDDDGSGYYRPDGSALSRAFLRYPVVFTEISSEFSSSRFHPILHRDRPHLGVDFAAPRGTPVRAAAAGWVSQAGWNGGLGRAVRVEHDGQIATTYGHLDEIAPAVREGALLRQGQVLGWVGSTGLATGPHLHYEIEQAGEHVDPMAISPAQEPPLAEVRRRTFDRIRGTVTRELAQIPPSDFPVRVALSANSWRVE